MQETSALYKTLRSLSDSWYETQVLRGNVTYGDNVMNPYPKPILGLRINPALFDDAGPKIGNARASVCKLQIEEAKENWPRMAPFTVRTRIVSADGTQTSEWISLGQFYTDVRKPSYEGTLFITAYDSMLMLKQRWTDNLPLLPTDWPITAKTAATLLQDVTGVELEDDSMLDNTVAFIGLNTESTAWEIWMDIAAAHGCNLQMRATGQLRMVPFADYEDEELEALDLGKCVSDFDPGVPLSGITGVVLETEAGVQATAGVSTGYLLKGVCNFSDSAAAQLCLTHTLGLSYRPFNATDADLDPAMEPGDLVTIDETVYQIMTIDWTICAKPTADICADFEEEVDHEYTVQGSTARALRLAKEYTNGQIVTTRSYIQQTAQSILQGVATNYVDNVALQTALANYSPTAQIAANYYSKTQSDQQAAALASEIELTDSRLTLAFSELQADVDDTVNALSYYIRYENGVVIIGKTDSPTSIRISNTQIGIYYGNEAVSYWDQNQQLTPKELAIPTGGKFILGRVLFQPRTSGNLSLMYVGS